MEGFRIRDGEPPHYITRDSSLFLYVMNFGRHLVTGSEYSSGKTSG
jgi:hypothetical protein